jgi:hypothetical protein
LDILVFFILGRGDQIWFFFAQGRLPRKKMSSTLTDLPDDVLGLVYSLLADKKSHKAFEQSYKAVRVLIRGNLCENELDRLATGLFEHVKQSVRTADEMLKLASLLKRQDHLRVFEWDVGGLDTCDLLPLAVSVLESVPCRLTTLVLSAFTDAQIVGSIIDRSQSTLEKVEFRGMTLTAELARSSLGQSLVACPRLSSLKFFFGAFSGSAGGSKGKTVDALLEPLSNPASGIRCKLRSLSIVHTIPGSPVSWTRMIDPLIARHRRTLERLVVCEAQITSSSFRILRQFPRLRTARVQIYNGRSWGFPHHADQVLHGALACWPALETLVLESPVPPTPRIVLKFMCRIPTLMPALRQLHLPLDVRCAFGLQIAPALAQRLEHLTPMCAAQAHAAVLPSLRVLALSVYTPANIPAVLPPALKDLRVTIQPGIKPAFAIQALGSLSLRVAACTGLACFELDGGASAAADTLSTFSVEAAAVVAAVLRRAGPAGSGSLRHLRFPMLTEAMTDALLDVLGPQDAAIRLDSLVLTLDDAAVSQHCCAQMLSVLSRFTDIRTLTILCDSTSAGSPRIFLPPACAPVHGVRTLRLFGPGAISVDELRSVLTALPLLDRLVTNKTMPNRTELVDVLATYAPGLRSLSLADANLVQDLKPLLVQRLPRVCSLCCDAV